VAIPARKLEERAVPTRCNHRDVRDDFFCLRYQVWYPSFDCAVRTRFKTSAGCRNCHQGRFNQRRHDEALRRHRDPLRE
jgi:hypothetical protein